MSVRKLNKSVRIILGILILAVTICGYLYYIDYDAYRHLIQEDGLIENTGVITISVLAMFMIVRFINVASDRSTRWKIFNSLTILALIFVIGEEISWGQRIFHWEVNEFFALNNLQGETNLHNLKLFGIKLNKVIFSLGMYSVLAVYFFLSRYLYRTNEMVHKIVNNYGIPIPNVYQILILMVSSTLVLLIPDTKKWELWEAIIPMVVFLIWLNPYNKEEKLLMQRA